MSQKHVKAGRNDTDNNHQANDSSVTFMPADNADVATVPRPKRTRKSSSAMQATEVPTVTVHLLWERDEIVLKQDTASVPAVDKAIQSVQLALKNGACLLDSRGLPFDVTKGKSQDVLDKLSYVLTRRANTVVKVIDP